MLLAVVGGLEILDTRLEEAAASISVPPEAGDAMLGVGLLFVATGFVLRLLAAVPERYPDAYVATSAAESELPELREFASARAGDHFGTLERWRERYARNPNTFFLVWRVRRSRMKKKQELVGFFSVIPLLQQAQKLVGTNKLDARGFLPEHVARPNGRWESVYVSGIVGVGLRGKGHTLSFLLQQLGVERDRGTKWVFARPMEPDGLRLVRKYGLSPVDPAAQQPGAIYRADLQLQWPLLSE